ncbi:MFS transporter [Desulfonatronum parangueonense]
MNLPVLRFGSISLALSTGLSVWLILFFGAGLTTYLNYTNFQRSHAALVQSRIHVIAQDLQHQIVASLDLGLRLDQMDALSPLVLHSVAADPDISGAGIHDPSGLRLIDTDLGAPSTVPSSWLVSPQQGLGYWHLTQNEFHVYGMPLFNSFNVLIGTLTVRYDRSVDEPVEAMLLNLLRNLLLTAFCFAVLITVGLVLLKRRFFRHLGALAHRIETKSPSRAAQDLSGLEQSPLARRIEALVATCDSMESRLRQVVDGQSDPSILRSEVVATVPEENPVDFPADEKAAWRELNRGLRLLVALGLLMVLLATAAVTMLAWLEFRERFEPQLHQKIDTLGHSLAGSFQRLYLQGLPIERIKGVVPYFDRLRQENPELAYIALVGQGGFMFDAMRSDGTDHSNAADVGEQGLLLHASGTVPEQIRRYFQNAAGDESWRDSRYAEGGRSLVLDNYVNRTVQIKAEDGRVVASLLLGQDRSFVDRMVREVWWDLGTVLLVILLITFELMLFVMNTRIRAPISAILALAGQVRAGDFAQRLKVHGKDEIGRLSAALNASLDRVNASLQRLRNASRNNPDLRTAVDFLEHRIKLGGSASATPVVGDRLAIIRWPFFLFIFAESLSLSFFPLFVEQLYTPMPGLPQGLVIGLPISLFMLVWALSLPPGGFWSDQVGRKRAFLTGAVIASIGLLMTAFSQGILDLMLWRSLTAVGYGLVFITVQGYVVDHSLPTQRARAMAMFLAVFFGGSLCGAAIGGIVSERIGFAPVFAISAGLGLLAALFVGRYISGTPANPSRKSEKLRARNVLTLVRNRRFLAMTILNAIPAKMALTGFLFFAMPLYLKSLGLSPGDIGRVMMSYGLAMILLSPLVGLLADIWGRRHYFVLTGGLLAAVAIMLITLQPGPLASVLSILLLGAAHAVGISPQLALVMEWSKDEVAEIGPGTVMGIFRLLERIGNVMGPIVISLLIAALGFSGAFTAFSFYLLISVLLFAGLLCFCQKSRAITESDEKERS